MHTNSIKCTLRNETTNNNIYANNESKRHCFQTYRYISFNRRIASIKLFEFRNIPVESLRATNVC